MSVRTAVTVVAAGIAVAAAAALVAVLRLQPWIGLAGVVVAAAALVAASQSVTWLELATRTGTDRVAAAFRMILTVAVISAVSAGAALAYAAAGAVALGGWSLVAATAVAATTRHPAAAVRNLDGPPVAALLLRPWQAVRRATVAFAVVDVAAAALVIAAGEAAPALLLAVVAAAVVVTVAAGAALAGASAAALRRARGQRADLIDSITRLAPQAVLHVSVGAAQAGHVVGQWLPAIEALRLRTLVVVREPTRVAEIGQTSLPIVLALSGRDVADVVVPSVRVAFYAANGTLNGDLLREPTLRHVFLNHGDSDKSASATPINRVYDELWVAGEAAIDRYHAAGIDIPADRFTVVGRPQLQGVRVGPRTGEGPFTVLYAPTFEGYYADADYSSVEAMGATIVQTLLRRRPDVRVLFKPHPQTGQLRPAMAAARAALERMVDGATGGVGHAVVSGGGPDALYRAFDDADLLITDVSSVATDFLWTERPIIATNPRGLPHTRFAERFPTLRCAYVLDPDGSAVADLIGVATGEDPLREDRRRMKRAVLGDVGPAPLEAFAAAADRAYQRAEQHAAGVRNTFTFTAEEVHAPGASTQRP